MVKVSSAALRYPTLISFDAFGTLYTPRESVALQYHKIAKTHGIHKSEASIHNDFPAAFSEMKKEYPNYGKYSSGKVANCDDWWSELIVKLFKLEHFSNNRKVKEFCDDLVTHFTTSNAYRIYDDVIPTLEYLKHTKSIPMVISSNSDVRLITILQNLGLSKYFEQIYLSYDLGVSKPDQKFFDLVREKEESRLQQRCEVIWHVGDEMKHDYRAANDAGHGWQGLLIERAGEVHSEGSEFNEKGDESAAASTILKDLRELQKMT